jgi:dTDP-4-amino-4,6-dideoxygalactose transaminase
MPSAASTAKQSRSALAIEGGTPVRLSALPPWPHFGEEELAAVSRVLESGRVNYWTGEEGKRFEREYAAYCGREFALSLANGTVALELALHALGIGSGDEVVVPCRTFIASASAVVLRGAKPVMADVDVDSQVITASTLRAAITPKTRAVIVVHLAGWPCDMDSIMAVAQEHGLKVIEDCAQSHGARWRGRPVGSFGDAAAFSFCQDKILTTGGEGGMLLLDDEEAWNRAWSYRDHGKSYQAMFAERRSEGFHWVHDSFGTNWRMTEMQAAIGRVLLRDLDRQVARRRENARFLNSRLDRCPGVRPTVPTDDAYHSYYKYYFFLRPEALKSGWTRDRVVAAINAEGIPATSGHCGEIFRERAFNTVGRPEGRLAVAEELFATAVMCPVHPTLERRDLDDIANAIEKVMHSSARA